MPLRRFTIPCVAVLLLVLCATNAYGRPNVICILIDDMGYGDLGCYGNGEVKTPNIDRLAREGVRFTQFYVNAPICSPSRVALMTGQYPQRHRITSFIASRRENEQRGMANWLPTTAPSLARMLSASGYHTGHFGKWHMGGGRDVGEAPLISEYGFDASLTQFEGLGDRVLCTFDTLFQDREHHAHPLSLDSAKLGRGHVEFVKRADITRRFVDGAIAFIRSARDADQPFYVNVWPDDVHSPHEPSPASRGDGSEPAMYRGVIDELDRQLGPLFDLVRDDPKLRDNTLIIFASDNGHDPIIPGAANLRGHKGNLYEGGIRVPLVIWWPSAQRAAAAAGTTNDRTVVAGFDLPATVLKIAEVSPSPQIQLDGADMTDAFAGHRPARASALFWSRPPDRPGPKNSFPDFAVRAGRWKLLAWEKADRVELYDVIDDSRETKNLADTEGAVVRDLRGKLKEWRQSVGQ